MKWYSLEEKVPNRGDRIILVEKEGNLICPNFIYDSEFYERDEDLEKEVWQFEKGIFSKWGYMDDFLNEIF